MTSQANKGQEYADVIVDIPTQEVDRPFQYLIPPTLKANLKVGSMVLVPFGRTKRVGYIISFSLEQAVPKLLPILELLDDSPVFGEEMVGVCRWMAEYYISTFGESLKLAFPPGRARRLYQEVTLNPEFKEVLNQSSLSIDEKRVVEKVTELSGITTLDNLRKLFGRKVFPLLNSLEEKQIVKRGYGITQPRIDVLSEKYVKLKILPAEAKSMAENLTIKAPRQHRLLEALADVEEISVHELISTTGSPRSSLDSLAKKNAVEFFNQTTFRGPDFSYFEAPQEIDSLTVEQKDAVGLIEKSLSSEEGKIFLLQGITGSGKTEVYLQTIAKVLSQGKTAIVLVPEIALAPQTIHRVRQRFGQVVAVLHSGLGLGERYDQWRKIIEGEFRVVVGARSAIFAPLKNLGLVVIDEEPEASYKQNRNPRYHAREVAIKRAELNRATVILGSATPSMETKAKAEKGEFELIHLPKRVGKGRLPEVSIVDMRKEAKQKRSGVFSLPLRRAIEECILRGEKVILFLNRRGFSNFVLCRDCGHVMKCKKCEVSLTYHRDRKALICHHCDYTVEAPSVCPKCRSHNIGYFGVGTQQVEQELKKFFPEVSVTRMDADTTARKGAHRKKLLEFTRQKSGILLGTQMIAKGLDFPEVTLVGVINADTALNLPDFRSAERTFQILMQVSGRAGRGALPGKVIIQTYIPESYAIESLLTGDYDSFYAQEIKFRQELNYPPFSQLVNIGIAGKEEQKVIKGAIQAGECLAEKLANKTTILGPAPAPISRVKNKHRWHLVLKTFDEGETKTFLKDNMGKILPKRKYKDVTLSIDIDPTSLL